MNEDTVVLSMEDFAGMKTREAPKPKELKEIVEYTLEGVYIRTWESAAEAAQHHGVAVETIRCSCRGYYKYCHKTYTIFTYRGEDIEERLKEIDSLKNKSAHVQYRNICEYTLGGKLLCKWPTVRMAAQANKIPSHNVGKCCKGNRLFIGNRIFIYEGEDIKQRVREVKAELYRLSKKRPKYREVDEYTLDGKFVKGYSSASAASKELGIHISLIARCCNGEDKRGKHLTTKGRIFLWIGSSISERLEQIKTESKNIKVK